MIDQGQQLVYLIYFETLSVLAQTGINSLNLAKQKAAIWKRI